MNGVLIRPSAIGDISGDARNRQQRREAARHHQRLLRSAVDEIFDDLPVGWTPVGKELVAPNGARLPYVRGGATPANGAGTPASPAVDPFLVYARSTPFPVLVGTLAAARTGGTAADQIVWVPAEVPEVPNWLSYLDLVITLPVAMVLPAGATATISPYAPYSAFTAQMLLAGAPEWPAQMSLVPWWLDEVVNSQMFDPAMAGPGLVSDIGQNFGKIPAWYDLGPTPEGFNTGATTVLPGTTVQNAGTVASTVHFVMQFTVRMRFQRRFAKMWGMIPMGDPQNRPQFKMNLNSLVGPQPDNNLIQDIAAAGITASIDTAGVTVDAIFRSKSLDILPQGVQLGPPAVQLGLNATYDNSFPIVTAGAILYKYQRTAQIYTSIHQLLVNNQAPIDADYWALWLTQNAQSARWYYDKAQGNLQDYYASNLRKYHRYLPKGHFLVDMEGGENPDNKPMTPYNGLMSPDSAYAAAAGVAATPNMCTAFRVPSGTAISSAYLSDYTFGLVKVPY